MQQGYVVGFAFNADLSRVVLIEKKRPERLAGRLNGIGGSIKDKETAQEAMCREFKEETGVLTRPREWRYIETRHPDGDNVLFYCMAHNKTMRAKTKTDETVFIMETNSQDIGAKALPDLQELLPHAVALLQNKR